MRVLLVVNSSASSVTARSRVVIQKALSADHEVSFAETNRRGHAMRLAQSAANAGVDLVVCLGGDGTLNEVANGLAGSQTALAALPGGSTNVFARTIGLPNDPIEATGALLDGLAAGRIEPVGLGVVNGRYFLFHVGIGFDAEVVHQVERRSGLKRYAGHPLFMYAALTSWFRHYDHRRPRFSITVPDGAERAASSTTRSPEGSASERSEPTISNGYFSIVMNTNPYTYLGNRPFNVIPEATLDRGLAVLTLRSLKLGTILGAAAGALGFGRDLKRRKDIDVRTDLTALTVDGHGPFPYQVDGDYLGEIEHLQFRHEPDVLRLVLPA